MATTWLALGPLPQPLAAPEKLQPHWGQKTAGAQWRLKIGAGLVTDFSEELQSADTAGTVYYTSGVLRTEKGGQRRLSLVESGTRGKTRVFLNGVEVISYDPSVLQPQKLSVFVSLQAGANWLVVETQAYYQHAYFVLAVHDPAARSPRSVAGDQLELAAAGDLAKLAERFARALELTTDLHFARAGAQVRFTARLLAGCPRLGEKFNLELLGPAGRIGPAPLEPWNAAALRQQPVSGVYTVGPDDPALIPLRARLTWAKKPAVERTLRLVNLSGCAREAEEGLQEVARLEQRLGRRLPLSRLEWERARLWQEKIASGEVLPGASAAGEVRRTIARARWAMSAEPKSPDPLAGRTGYLLRAYFSEVDESAQPFQVYVPTAYARKEKGEKYPLCLFLHGYVPSYDKHCWWEPLPQMHAVFERRRVLLALPFGRSNTDFLTIGEMDVLQVIEEMKRWYDVDEDRIYVYGYSMGGSGAYTLMAHFPDLFAAGEVLAGRCDWYLWQKRETETPQQFRQRLPAFKRLLIDSDNPLDQVPNFRHLPLEIRHGTLDSLVPIAHARAMRAALAEAGFTAQLQETPGGDHWAGLEVLLSEEPLDFLLRHRRDPSPCRVSLKAYLPRYARAYWVEIERFESFGTPAEVDLEHRDGRLTFHRLQNVGELFLRGKWDEEALAGGKPPGFAVRLEATGLRLRREGLAGEKAPLGRKTLSGRCGPVKEAFNTPFLGVYGTTDPPSAGTIRQNAQRLADDWQAFAKGKPRLISDQELTPEDVRRRNLVLFGAPSQNAYLKQIAERLPVTFDERSLVLGERKISLQGRGLVFVCPNPENLERYVVVNVGLLYGAHLPINHKWDLVPDLLVFEEACGEDRTNLPVAAAFFDLEWRLSRQLTWFFEPATRGSEPRQTVP